MVTVAVSLTVFETFSRIIGWKS